MQTIEALQGGARTYLVHNFGNGIDGEDRFVVERFKALIDGDIRPIQPKAPKTRGRRKAKRMVVIPHDYPALIRARRRHARWSEDDRRLYRRHLWRSEGNHGEAKTWHGLGRAVQRGLDNMKIQAYLTAAAINLKRLATALLAILWAIWASRAVEKPPPCAHHAHTLRTDFRTTAA